MNITELTAVTILEDFVFCELLDEKDEVYRERKKIALEERAGELGVKTKFLALLKAFLKKEKTLDVLERKPNQCGSFDNYTTFEGPYLSLYCGNWVATDEGIYTFTVFGEQQACYHPIIPIERLKNLETGMVKIKLAFKRQGKWQEIVVDKEVIASSNKIVALSALGISVTSENAKFLVRFLSDVENFNDDRIPMMVSTSKLGWIGEEFMPYDSNVIFDGNDRFRDTFAAISEVGDFQEWIDCLKKIRATGRIEPKMSLAASFASPLLKIIGALPFFLNLWGFTEGGKTVSLMLAASVWADPGENKYIGDFKSTDVAIEIKMDFLNNLPIMLDDTSQVSSKVRDNFESFIYDLCSGKGKSRSNRSLGINRENHWNNVILTNGERPLSNDNLQGGAINRILDLEVGASAIYSNGNEVASCLKKNYGFAGKKFIEIIQSLGKETIVSIQKECLEAIRNTSKMDKQSMSLSILLAADRIATDFIFKDGQYIDIDEAAQVLVDRANVSDNERCLEYILSEVAINGSKFKMINEKEATEVNSDQFGELWGIIDEHNGVIIINGNRFDSICRQGSFSPKSFLLWSFKKSLIIAESEKVMKKNKKINGVTTRCVFLKIPENSKFMEIDENTPIPFN